MCRIITRQAVELKPNLRVELTLRGEPTLNPDILENLSIIREEAPEFQISLFTNGVKTFGDPCLIVALLDAGVNILCIDCYNNTYQRFLEAAKRTKEQVVDFREFSAYRRYRNGHKLRVINLVPDIQEGSVDVRKIHNNAGNVDPEYLSKLEGYVKQDLPLARGCSRPFTEVVVYYNGDVPICCSDWKAEYVLGNVMDQDLSDIWYGKRHYEALVKLHMSRADRSLPPCAKCDYHGGYRLGLLQDPIKNPR
jgi:radical SAM protein with 4Fe4S-binding SPASM domain